MVISGVNTVTYNGDGITTAWPYTYEVTDASEIRIQLNNADGTAVIVESDYYVDLVNSTVYYPGYAPGSEPPEAEQPPKVQEGQTITVYREIPITQESDLGDKWPFEVIEKGLDKLTMIAQQIDSGTKRTIDAALASMFQLAGIVTDSGKLQHITDQYNAIDANAAAAAESEENAAASALLSEKWASYTDGVVADGNYSAKKYATDAGASATNAANSDASATATAAALTAYLDTKETLTAPAVDATLAISGAAADAKVTGDKVSLLKDIDLKALSGESHFPNMVQGGLDNTTGELTAQKWAVSSPDWFSLDYPVELHVAAGYQFRVAYKNRETEVVSISAYNNHNSHGYVIVGDTSDFKIMITRDPITFSAADPDTFAKQVTFSLPSWYVEQVNKMNIEKLKNGNCLLDGLMVRGSYQNGNYLSYVYYRVATRRIIQFDYDINILANTGFRFGVQTFNDDDTYKADLGWKTIYTIPANQKFIVIIARTANTEDASEIADIMYFWNQISVDTPLKEQVENIPFNVNFLRDFFKCGGKPKLCSHAGYKVGSIENSIPAFEAAGQHGYWCLESDVQQTSDGYFIMMHDTTVDRTTDGTGSISSMTLAQIRALHLKGFPDLQVPTLQEYLAICKRYNMVPQLEIKGTVSNHASLIAEIKKAGMYWNTMLSGSEYSISNIRQITNDIPYIVIAQAGAYPSGYDGIINRVKAFKNVGIALEHTGTITETQVLTCHDADMPICIFTCDTEAKVKEMFELGADCITTNVVLP